VLKDRRAPNKRAANSQIAVTADGKEIVAVSLKANRIHIDRTLSPSANSGKVARPDPVSAMVLAALERKRLSAGMNDRNNLNTGIANTTPPNGSEKGASHSGSREHALR
jgi:hypothetical protein